MKLLLIRHAIATDRDEFAAQGTARAPSRGDDQRPLTNEGARRMRQAARGLCKAVEAPDALFCSPLARARSTAEILIDRAWPELSAVVADELRPGRHPAEILGLLKAAVRNRGPLGLAAMVGHEPHLSSLAGWLMTANERSLFALKKGGACLLQFQLGRPSGRSAGQSSGLEAGRAQLVWLSTPRMLRALS